MGKKQLEQQQVYVTAGWVARIIDEGQRYEFNRQLLDEAFNDLDRTVRHPVMFALLHQHRGGEACEPHARLQLALMGKDGELRAALADVRLELFKELPHLMIKGKGTFIDNDLVNVLVASELTGEGDD